MSLTTHISGIREIILLRITEILQNTYHESVPDLSESTLSAKLAFKGDPQLNELRLALERIDRGEFGNCIFCKGAIAEHTLLDDPTAHFCEQCARKLLGRSPGS